MAVRETQTVDARARVTLPKGFAKATVILEKISETELRIRKAGGTARAVREFPEHTVTMLSDRDRDRFLELIGNPPPPNAALRKAMSKRRKDHG
jgi:uncharacterized protein (DUF1778 family)